jgi:anti-sigma factor RsiW
MSEYLTCSELVELVTDYLDGALSPADRARFEEHVLTCPPCRSHITQLRRTVDVLGRLTPEALPAEIESDLVKAFRGWSRGA